MKSILLIYTGGTIGMKTDPASGMLMPFDFSQIEQEVPELAKFHITIDVHTFLPVIDSSNVEPGQWQELALLIGDNYEKYDGFVVLHGTDTMSYTASAMSYMLRSLAKPVVFTGSQIPIGVLRTDGRENMISAIEIASEGVVNEVTVFFQNMLLRANRTTKYNAEYLNAFRSDNYPPLAEAGINIVYNQLALLPKPNSPFYVDTSWSDDVISLKIFPGIRREYMEAVLGLPSLRGVVIETYGSGNAPTDEWFASILARAVDRGIIVFNVTQCAAGCVDMTLYETGRNLLKAGVISGKDMTFEAAITKLIHLLGHEIEEIEIKTALKKSICGEITLQ